MGYTAVAIKGVSWVGAFRFITRGIAFLRTIILARILTPGQFGAFGIAMLALSLLEVLSETGVNVFLIQQKEVNRYINTAWMVSIIRGFLIFVLLFFSAGIVSEFFNTPQAEFLLQLISIVPLIRGFINPSVIKFQKDLQFSSDFFYRFSIYTLDASVAIVATLLTKNPAGIVFGLIAGAVFEVILSFLLAHPRPIFNWDKHYIHNVFSHGKWVTASGIFNYLFYNLDNIIVGRILGTYSLGLYQMAYSFSFLPISEVTDVFSKVTFPVYSKILDDKKRLRRAFIKTTSTIFFLVLPVGIVLYFFAEEIVMLLGREWQPVVPLLKILAIFGVFRAVFGSTSALFFAARKQRYVAIMTAINLLGLTSSIFFLIQTYGLRGAAFAPVIGVVVSIPVTLYFIKKILF